MRIPWALMVRFISLARLARLNWNKPDVPLVWLVALGTIQRDVLRLYLDHIK